MQIVEVKNNLVKVSYDTSVETLVLSGFVAMKDSLQSFIGQVVHLESTSNGTFAIVKLFFNFDESGVIKTYNGSIPDAKSLMDIVQPQELLELFPIQTPIIIGELAQQKALLKLDRNIFERKLLICSEQEEDNAILTKNFAQQLTSSGKKVLVIDINGDFDSDSTLPASKVIAGRNFKLPLNYETINFIYEKGLDDAKAETKALIQEIFLEVQDYVRTLPQQFIPFETFKAVVDEQYEELELVELVLLKNKLLKYYEAGAFAQEHEEFDTLRSALEKDVQVNVGSESLTVLDLSKTDEDIQREMVSYAYSLIEQCDKEIYVIFNINNSNSDKKLLKQIFTTKNAYSALICPYSYKYLKELKQISKNLILFAPIQQQDDFASYNAFLNKLNFREFIVYGQATHHLPLIVKLDDISKLTHLEAEIETETESYVDSRQELLDEEIKRDVDSIFTAPKSEPSNTEESFSAESDDLTEEDLDFIDNLGVVDEAETDIEYISPEGIELAEEPNEEVISNVEIIEEVGEDTNSEPIKNILEEEIDEIADESEIGPEPPTNAFADFMTQPSQDELEPPAVDILPANMSSAPIVPIYSADIEPKVDSDSIEQGDEVVHPKYGKGTVEKLINYGSKTLCSINFDNVGRRLLDPSLAEIKKV